MAADPKPVEIGDMPELRRLVDSVRRAKRPRALQRNGRDVALLVPVDGPTGKAPGGGRTGPNDPLWGIVGIGAAAGPTDVSSNKHKYLAEAYNRTEP